MSRKQLIFQAVCLFVFYFLMLTLYGNCAHAAEPAPCVIWKNNRWQVTKQKCRQFNEVDMRAYNARLLKLKYYKTKLEPAHKKIVEDYARLDARWQVSLGLWNTTRATLQQSINNQKENALSWQQAFKELQKQKTPGRHWTEHPALWFTVGAVTVGVIAVVTAYAVVSAQK
ncbi:MAG: hypothetical protein KDB07_06210 [Planctomycetes bacterium]|nr:hypothetical protein [Planctomycetota bacterium]